MSDQNLIVLVRNALQCRRFVQRRLALGVLSGVVAFGGCATTSSTVWEKTVGNDTCEVDSIMQQVDSPSPPVFSDLRHTAAPITADALSKEEIEYDDQTLADVLHAGLSYSAVLRDIGGTILRSPETMTTSLSRQLQQTDPRFGAEAALSAFDAQFNASANFNQNDRVYNNSFFAGGATAFNQDYDDYQLELSKRTATGSLIALRGVSN
ncbi:MAG: hypothetical protein KDA85_08880, partial [Planctomycetaceae bacterium]|nr:hypothetical protein [Planctomycetaceae bacterium]